MSIDRPGAIIYAFPMTSRPSSLTDEAGSTPVPASEVERTASKEPSRQFLRGARRDLSDEELASPAVVRFLISELERADAEIVELKAYREKYHEQQIENATLREQRRKSFWLETLSYIMLSVGAAGLGAAPSYLGVVGAEKFGVVFGVLSALMLVVGILAKVKQ